MGAVEYGGYNFSGRRNECVYRGYNSPLCSRSGRVGPRGSGNSAGVVPGISRLSRVGRPAPRGNTPLGRGSRSRSRRGGGGHGVVVVVILTIVLITVVINVIISTSMGGGGRAAALPSTSISRAARLSAAGRAAIGSAAAARGRAAARSAARGAARGRAAAGTVGCGMCVSISNGNSISNSNDCRGNGGTSLATAPSTNCGFSN